MAVTAFVGSIPELYDRYLGPVIFEPYAIDLARRVPPGSRRVLELAAGTGRVTRHLIAALPADGALLVTDLSDMMIARGTQLLGSDPRVTWRTADMQALPFGDAEIDAVVCQFGLMFAPDKPLALREMKRVLRPGGVLLVSTWDRLAHNPASQLVDDHASATFAANPPQFMRAPFTLGDAAALRALAAAAGFADVRVDTVAKSADASSAADFATGLVRGNPLAIQLGERGADIAAFERAITDQLASRFGDRPCRSPLSAHVLTAIA